MFSFINWKLERKIKQNKNPTKKDLCGGSHENERETSRTEARDQGREERRERKKYWGNENDQIMYNYDALIKKKRKEKKYLISYSEFLNELLRL